MAKRKKKKAPAFDPEHIAELTEYKGIGPATAKALLTEYKTPDEVYKIGAPELQEAFGEKKGDNIFEAIHGEDAPKKDQRPSDRGRKPKYTEELGEAIAEQYSQGEATIKEIMEHHNLTERIFFYWQEENLHFFQLIKNASQARNSRKKEMALNGMKMLLQGHEYTEQSTEAKPVRDAEGNEKKVIQKTVLTRKFVPPNAGMIIFTLCNLEPAQWKSVQHIKHETGPEIPPYDFSDFSDDELEEFERLSAKAQKSE